MVNKQYSNNDLETFMKLAANWQSTHNHSLLEGVDIKGEMQHYLNNTAINNMYKKRERTQNWNYQEKKYLLDLCRKDMRIIENKRLDAGLTAVKNKAWKIIHQKFSTQFGTDRTCNRLKEQWRRMKACTRNEILDYNNRITRFGPEVADRKKPSPFTFEVWEFMQEAKKACKSEALDGIDYSKIPLALEEDFEYREDEHNNDEDHDIEDSRTPPQEMCDVDMKEELNDALNDMCHETGASSDHLPVPTPPNNHLTNDLERIALHSPGNYSNCGDPSPLNSNTNNNFMAPAPNDMSNAFQAGFNMNNISATLEALNALRAGQFPTAAAAAAALKNNLAAAAHQHQQHQHQQQQQQQQQQHQQQQQQQQQHHAQSLQSTSQNDETLLPAKRPRTSSCSNLTGPSTSLATITAPPNDERPTSPDVNTNLNNFTSPLASNTSSSNSNSNSANIANSINAGNTANHPNKTMATSGELKAFMDMQNKEHIMRMRILEVQLQAAKYNRDLVEINKTLAIQKLQEYASKRLGS